jgi:Domain of unknown function (DUF4386)
MTPGAIETSPQTYARIAGLLYLIIIVAGSFAELFVRSKLIVPRDAAATAGNIMASEPLWRIGFAATLVMLLCAVAVLLILYVLLRPVNRNIALLAVFFNLVSISIEGMNDLLHLAAVLILSGADYLKAFAPGQLNALALLSLKLFDNGYGISLVFFGFFCILTGYLIFKSTFLPRVLGVLMAIAGLCYLTNSFVLFLAPALAHRFFYILFPAGVAELLLTLWLLVKGVNVQRWKEADALSRPR